MDGVSQPEEWGGPERRPRPAPSSPGSLRGDRGTRPREQTAPQRGIASTGTRLDGTATPTPAPGRTVRPARGLVGQPKGHGDAPPDLPVPLCLSIKSQVFTPMCSGSRKNFFSSQFVYDDEEGDDDATVFIFQEAFSPFTLAFIIISTHYYDVIGCFLFILIFLFLSKLFLLYF